MSKFISVTNTDTDRDLITSSDHATNKSNNRRGTNNISVKRVMIANTSVDTATISLYIYQTASPNAEHYLIKLLDIPTETTFVWDEQITFNVSTHNLRLFNDGSNPGLTIIID